MENIYTPAITVKVSFTENVKRSELFKITSSKSCEELLRTIFDADLINWREEFIILCLSNSNQVLGYYKLSSGGITATVVDVRMLFTIALNCCATTVIIAHNHPSGTLTPSDSDKQITKKLKQGGELLDIKILDHLILTQENYYSFSDNGML